jgi:4-hydroxy-L-threonine phosphate dehydrogenase PdxA
MTSPTPSSPRIGVVIGDPNGVGPEIAIQAAHALHAHTGMRALLIGEDYIFESVLSLPALQAARGSFDTLSVGALARADWKPGTISAAAGAATVAYVRAAVDLAQRGQIAAIGAAPHCETAVNDAGIPFSGYSGLIADLTHTPKDRAFLLLQAQDLRVAHVTLHEGVISAVQRITPALIEEAVAALHITLPRLGVAQPRVCIVGINPHAGEGGLFGPEDEAITKPAVQAMRAKGWAVDGPLGADLALSERKHDAYVAMLHDQGHVAVKMLSPKGATAIVAGVPLLFASVGHGAAFDIAGQGRADASALTDTLAILARTVRAAA